jgi:cytochrome o ubiquinol oxidase subunit 1
LDHYDVPGWQWLFITAGIGLCLIGIGALYQVAQLYVSFRDRKQNLDLTGDPWNGRTLEWSTKSPPPFYNFAILPTVTDRDQFWADKQNPQSAIRNPQYSDIHMPKNTPMAIYLSGFVLLLGFALVWHIIWLIAVAFIGAVAVIIIRSMDEDTEYTITAQELERMENKSVR